MAKTQPQPQEQEKNEVKELKETLTPFAKLPYESAEPTDKVLYRLTRGTTSAVITNGDVIKAKKMLGML